MRRHSRLQTRLVRPASFSSYVSHAAVATAAATTATTNLAAGTTALALGATAHSLFMTLLVATNPFTASDRFAAPKEVLEALGELGGLLATLLQFFAGIRSGTFGDACIVRTVNGCGTESNLLPIAGWQSPRRRVE